METLRQFGSVEMTLLLAFVSCYILYLIRMLRIYGITRSFSKAIFAKIPLRLTYFTLMLLALLGPSFGHKTREIKSIGKDIFFLLDLSRSMDAFDVQPSRIEKVKIELRKIISKFSSDRCGLIIFSQDAYLQSPLTYDASALMIFVQALSTGMISNHSTNFAPALQLAIEKFESDAENRPGSEKSRVIVLISDGEDFGEGTEELASKLSDKGIRLFAVGVGTERGSRIPEGNGFKRDKQGQEVISRINRASLEKLAQAADGKYFEISDVRNETDKLINTISLLEGQLRESRTIQAADNKFTFFLLPALLLLMLDISLKVRVLKI